MGTGALCFFHSFIPSTKNRPWHPAGSQYVSDERVSGWLEEAQWKPLDGLRLVGQEAGPVAGRLRMAGGAPPLLTPCILRSD